MTMHPVRFYAVLACLLALSACSGDKPSHAVPHDQAGPYVTLGAGVNH